MAEPIPMERPKLQDQITNDPEVIAQAQALGALMGRIARVLSSPSALPARLQQATQELVVLSKDALALWGDLEAEAARRAREGDAS